jgi:uncharacterized membrane-anchored protein YhcB (DUF1043 family)
MECGDWTPLPAGSSIAEDVSKLPFTFSRQCTYVHPQKKNAFMPAINAKVSQVQYAYVWGRNSSKSESVQGIRPKRAMVLTVSQFEGIPFSEYFKVLSYYGMDNSDGSSANCSTCTVRFGAAVHFCKSTMLKSQIQSGVIADLNEFSNQYLNFLKRKLEAGGSPTNSDVGASKSEASAPKEEVDTTSTSTASSSTGMLFGLVPMETVVVGLIVGYLLLFVFAIYLWRQNASMSSALTQLENDKNEFRRSFDMQLEISKQLLASQGSVEKSLKTHFDMLLKLLVSSTPPPPNQAFTVTA